MKKKYSSIAKFFIMGVVVTTGAAFTSCSDNMEDIANAEKQDQMSGGDVFTYHSDKDGDLSIKISGTDAIVTRGTEEGTTVNAKVVYDNKFDGHIEMTDNTLSLKTIPFSKGTSTLLLDFHGTGNFSNDYVYLKNNVVTRGASAEEIGKEVAKIMNATTFESVFSSLVTAGVTHIGSSIAGMVWEHYFPTENPNVEYFNQLSSQLTQMDNHISQISNQIAKKDICDAFTEHMKYINALNDAVCFANEKFKSCTTREDSLQVYDQFANLNIANTGTNLINLKTAIDNYTLNVGGKNTFQKIDEYLVTASPFLSQSKDNRAFYRMFDAQTFTDAADLMYNYYMKSDHPTPIYAGYLKTSLADFDAYMLKNGGMVEDYDSCIVSTIYNAQVIMKDTVDTQDFGEKTFTMEGNKCKYPSNSVSWLEERVNSYFYSKNPMSQGKQELKDSCLTTTEANTIFNHFNSDTSKKTMYQILTDAGVKGLKNPNQIMLISASPTADPQDYRWYNLKYFAVSMNGSVWDNANNKLNNCYHVGWVSIDCPEYMGGDWYAQNSNVHPAYYTKVIKHFGGSGISAETAYNNFINTVCAPRACKVPGTDTTPTK